MMSLYETALRRPSLESPMVLAAAMIIGVTGLLGATKWGLLMYFADREVGWRQEIAEEQAHIRAVHAKRAEHGDQARAVRVSGGMRLLGDRVLEEIKTGLTWTASDNGADLSWKGAIEYCRSLELDGGGWTLPTTAQLLSLHDRQVTEPHALRHSGRKGCSLNVAYELG